MEKIINPIIDAVVPGYYLVCYNQDCSLTGSSLAVVPGYYLVCYNKNSFCLSFGVAVVPGYYLVCYNTRNESDCAEML